MGITVEQRPPEKITVTCSLNSADWMQISEVGVRASFTVTMGSYGSPERMSVVVSKADAAVLVQELEKTIKYLEKHR